MLSQGRPLDARKSDAIVVLTGGPGRIDRGLELLRQGASRHMLVSGVAPEVKPGELAAQYHIERRLMACCIELGHQASDTRQNADETAAWVHAHGYKSVRLVTADWHMPRARWSWRTCSTRTWWCSATPCRASRASSPCSANITSSSCAARRSCSGRTDMNWLRTILFSLFFYGLTLPMLLAAPFVALASGRALRSYSNFWVRLMTWSARWILGIEARIEGEIPAGPAIFAAKHESTYEALELTRLLKSPATVMKRELAAIPIWGWCARRYGVIVVDRGANASALRSMMRDAGAALDEGRSIMIFPEGTRCCPASSRRCAPGSRGSTNCSSCRWCRSRCAAGMCGQGNGAKRPGVITLHFGAPIPPGLPRAEAEARVHAGINALND